MAKTRPLWMIAVCLFLGLGGCYNDALDPTQLGSFDPTPSLNVILDTLGVADEPPLAYDGAEDPRPEDLLPYEADYVFSAGDVVQISIFELYNERQSYVNQFVVTESGRLSIPDVGLVMAEGLTEAELEREIVNILSPNIIKDPSVTVTLLNSQRRLFSIIGNGVSQSARIPMPRYPIRLTDAIASAGGIGDFNVSYIYISRDVKSQDLQPTGTRQDFEPTPTEPSRSVEDEMLDMITPSVADARSDVIVTTAEMASRGELEALAAPEGVEPLNESEAEFGAVEPLPMSQSASRIEWVFEDGKWQAVEMETDAVDSQPDLFGSKVARTEPAIRSDFGLADVGEGETVTRVIKIPVDRLLAGDPRYNIVIRPADRITVPRDLVGEFYVSGNVNAPNAYPITGRPITLMQAITIAGGLNAIAWPQKVEVRRRIGENDAGLMQEEIVLVDLKKIAEGTQPDFFIKQHDLINVGTHGTSRWLAVLRNAFRATYGFGLIYDRNFADSDWDPLRDSLR